MILRVFVLLVLSFSLIGCVNLKPRDDTRKVYTLGALELPVADSMQQGERGYIARPHFPGYMEGDGMKVRSADGEIRDLEGARWAEPIEVGVARALSHYIESASGGIKSGFYPWPQLSFAENVLYIRFHQLDATSDGRIQLSASWELKRTSGDTQSGVFTMSDVTWTTGEPRSLVAGMNAALEALAEQIFSSLKKR